MAASLTASLPEPLSAIGETDVVAFINKAISDSKNFPSPLWRGWESKGTGALTDSVLRLWIPAWDYRCVGSDMDYETRATGNTYNERGRYLLLLRNSPNFKNKRKSILSFHGYALGFHGVSQMVSCPCKRQKITEGSTDYDTAKAN